MSVAAVLGILAPAAAGSAFASEQVLSGTTVPIVVVVAERVANPPASMQPSVAFDRYCFGPGRVARCNAAALADINLARRGEHVAPLRLPKGFAARSVPAQILTITNLERSARHLKTMPLNGTLAALALAGARRSADPSGPSGYAWGSNLASGYDTPLAADFGWMYDDGPGSPNSACSSAGQAGCWAHRHNIVVPWGGAQGTAGYVGAHHTEQLTQLFVENY